MKSTVLMAAMIAGLSLPALDASAQGHGERPDFATLDANGDGALTMAELTAQGASRFSDADTNGDGLLSEAELTARASERNAGRAARAVERMLSRLDSDGDGNISQAELPDHTDRAERFFAHADADENGSISAEEFEAAKSERGHRRGHGRGEGRHGPRGDN